MKDLRDKDPRLQVLIAVSHRIEQLERQRTLLIRECVNEGVGVRRTARAARLSGPTVSRIARGLIRKEQS